MLSQRVMVLDGAMGTMLQRYGFSENDGYASLSVSHPNVVGSIHRQYIDAGADIISTNTFCTGKSEHITDICIAAAKIARQEADRFMAGNPDRKIFVAGTVGPCDYHETQIVTLVEGGCDLLLFETVYDADMLIDGLNAARLIANKTGKHIPIMVSATIDVCSGRLLSGESIGELWQSIAHFNHIISFGLNCSSGAAMMQQHIADLSAICDRYVSCHPSAGLPDKNGHYGESPVAFADHIEAMLRKSDLNIIGACCGTTPDHIRALSHIAALYPPRQLPAQSAISQTTRNGFLL